MYRRDGFLTHEKHRFSRFNPLMANVWLCASIRFIAKAQRIGTCKRLNIIGASEVIIQMRSSNTFSPLNFSFNNVPSIRFPIICLITSCMSLHSLGGFELGSKMDWESIFKCRSCCGSPDKSSQFRNSEESLTTSFRSISVSTDLMHANSPGNVCYIWKLIYSIPKLLIH